MTTQEIKAKYTKSNEVKAQDAKFGKAIKATFIIIPIIFIAAYVIYNLILGNPTH